MTQLGKLMFLSIAFSVSVKLAIALFVCDVMIEVYAHYWENDDE